MSKSKKISISMSNTSINGPQIIGNHTIINLSAEREEGLKREDLWGVPGPRDHFALAISKPARLFYSYAEEDGDLQQALEQHLALLQREGFIEGWSQRRVTPGQDSRAQINQNLEQADLILLLVSAAFMASDYCYESEMKRALERDQVGSACVVPVILRPVDWRFSRRFGHLAPLPRYGKAVTSWANRDEAWLDITQGIRALIPR